MSVTLLADEHRIARKQHLCQSCERPIERGERYRNQRLAGDGSAWTWKEHERCHDIYWRLHRESGLLEDEYVEPAEVRAVLDTEPTPASEGEASHE